MFNVVRLEMCLYHVSCVMNYKYDEGNYMSGNIQLVDIITRNS
jgi:hypothetical protein